MKQILGFLVLIFALGGCDDPQQAGVTSTESQIAGTMADSISPGVLYLFKKSDMWVAEDSILDHSGNFLFKSLPENEDWRLVFRNAQAWAVADTKTTENSSTVDLDLQKIAKIKLSSTQIAAKQELEFTWNMGSVVLEGDSLVLTIPEQYLDQIQFREKSGAAQGKEWSLDTLEGEPIVVATEDTIEAHWVENTQPNVESLSGQALYWKRIGGGKGKFPQVVTLGSDADTIIVMMQGDTSTVFRSLYETYFMEYDLKRNCVSPRIQEKSGITFGVVCGSEASVGNPGEIEYWEFTLLSASPSMKFAQMTPHALTYTPQGKPLISGSWNNIPMVLHEEGGVLKHRVDSLKMPPEKLRDFSDVAVNSIGTEFLFTLNESRETRLDEIQTGLPIQKNAPNLDLKALTVDRNSLAVDHQDNLWLALRGSAGVSLYFNDGSDWKERPLESLGSQVFTQLGVVSRGNATWALVHLSSNGADSVRLFQWNYQISKWEEPLKPIDGIKSVDLSVNALGLPVVAAEMTNGDISIFVGTNTK